MAEVNGIFSEFNLNLQEKNEQNNYIPKDNKLERSPSSDSFSSSQQPERNKNKARQIGTIVAAAAITALAYASGKRTSADALSAAVAKNQQHEKTIQTLQQTIQQGAAKAEAAATQNTQKASLSIQEKQLRGLVEVLEPQIQQGENTQKAHAYFVQTYTEAIRNPKLGYNPLEAPVDKISSELYGRKIYRITEVPAFIPKAAANTGIIEPKVLRANYLAKGGLEIALPATGKVKPVVNPEAFIGNKTISGLGETVDTVITTDYGKRINWSARKIARDIMQNFYDGHGNTLDGVKIALTKQPNGATKIKISGLGIYDYRSLQLLGSGTKVENGFNAGGFGEGSKILAANLLGKGETSAVTYSCADWKYTLSTPKNGSNIIQQTLKKTPEILQGNSIEFETKNNDLINAIVESVNYFEHAQNPDFQKLTFDSEGFAFKILGGDKKGNIYLTQRFEFEGEGKWEDSIDTMNLIFKKKPDPEEYLKITGQKLPQDRDRTSLTFEDIKNLTHYFAHEMSDDNIIKSILSTKQMWGTEALGTGRKSALASFLEGIIEEAKSRDIKLDLQGEKFVARSRYMNDTVVETLTSYGYKFLPENFESIGIESATTAFKRLSVHTALEPTTVEVKKLKLLEQGLGVVQENIQAILKTHLKSANIQINPKYCEGDFNIRILINILSKTSHTFDYLMDEYKYIDSKKIENLSSEEFSKLCKKISNEINKLFSSMSENPDNKTIKEICRHLNYLNDNSISEKTKDYIRSLTDLNLITSADVTKPRYIFDRHAEIANNTLGEAIIKSDEYNGHWVDREYLNTADFYQLLGTWLHECCHKIGGDGTSEFTYALTDMLRVLLRSNSSSINAVKLNALSEVFNKL